MSSESPSVPQCTGRCACGTHRFTIHGRPTNVANCHCAQCRFHSGMPFSTWFTVEEGQYEGDSKEEGFGKGNERSPTKNVIRHTTSLSERTFCAHCGTPLLMRYYVTPTIIHIPLGIIDISPPSSDEPGAKEGYEALKRAFLPRQDIWVSSRAWWLPAISDDEKRARRQYEEDDEEFMELCRRWQAEHAKP